MAGGIRPRTLGAGFGVLFLIVGVATWQYVQTSPDATVVWFDAFHTWWIYFVYMVVGAVFLVGIGGLGLSIRSSFAAQIRDLDARLGAMVRGSSGGLPPPLPDTMNVRDTVDRDIDELLESLSEVEATATRESQRLDQDDGSMQGSYIPEDSGLAEKRERLVLRRRYLSRFLIGPSIVAALILGVSGMMLPGYGGFAQAAYQVNTAVILGIGYSWTIVGTYIAATVYALVGGGREDVRQR
jgi:hypothetical protein